MISAETVKESWQRLSQTGIVQAPQVVQQMKDEQPVVVRYLFSLVDAPFSDHERKIVAYIGIVVWQIMTQSEKRLLKVTRRKLEKAQQANRAQLETLASDPSTDLVGATMTIVQSHPEPEVLSYIVEAIAEEHNFRPDDPPIRVENRGLAYLHLKIVLDAFVDSLA